MRSFIRQQNDIFLSLRDDVEAILPDKSRRFWDIVRLRLREGVERGEAGYERGPLLTISLILLGL